MSTTDRSVTPLGQGHFDSLSRLKVRSDVTALDILCGREAVSRLKTAVEELNTRDRRSFLRGYRLAVATPLNELLWFVVDHAEQLGLQHDDKLYNWLHYRTPARGETLLSAVSDPTSGLSRLCYVFNDLAISLRRAEGGLTDTITAIEKCRATVKLFDEILAGTEVVSLDTREELPDRESLLRLCLAERVLDYVEYDPSIVSLAHRLVWRDDEEFSPVDDPFVLRAETHLSHVSLFLFGKGVPTEWRDGIMFGFDLIIRLNGVMLPTHTESDPVNGRDWLHELVNYVNPSHPEGKWPSQVYGLTEVRQTDLGGLVVCLGVNMEAISSKHRLAAILGSDRVRLISDDGGATDVLELEVTLSGAVAAYGDSKVHLLLLSHSVASDDREWVSVAFRLPMYGTLGSNASRWFLFYKMYHKGPVFDTYVARARKAVKSLLQRFKGNVDVEEIGGLDSEDFLPLCVLPAFRAMREFSHRAVETNADLRSGNSELLGAFWLVAQGYRHVKVSFKRASLGKSDYDAIGVKDGKCLVIEVKGADLSDDEHQREIAKFADRIKHLRGRMPALKQALGSESDITAVSGLFIFLGDLDRFKPADPSIPLWSHGDFVDALRTIGLPKRIVDVLDKSDIIHSLRTDGFPQDPFFAGLENPSVED